MKFPCSPKLCEIHFNKTRHHHKCGKKKVIIKKTVSAERRLKISLYNKANGIKPPSRNGCIPWNKGLKGFRAGEKSHLWKGGITPVLSQIRHSFEYRQWRSDVFTRDKFTCQFCGKIGRDLNADHIKTFASILRENNVLSLDDALRCEELWNIKNGRTLCLPCHKLTDTYLKK